MRVIISAIIVAIVFNFKIVVSASKTKENGQKSRAKAKPKSDARHTSKTHPSESNELIAAELKEKFRKLQKEAVESHPEDVRKEDIALILGRLDNVEQKLLYSAELRNPFLCVGFTKANFETSINLSNNILHTRHLCDWAIIVTEGTPAEIKSLCFEPSGSSKIVHCKLMAYKQSRQTKHVPSSILYFEVLPLLPKYQSILFLEEDVSLMDFSLSNFVKIWACSFQTPPLVAQPLVVGDTKQLLRGAAANRTDALATEVDEIGGRVWAVNSVFLEWFVKRVLVQVSNIYNHLFASDKIIKGSQ